MFRKMKKMWDTNDPALIAIVPGIAMIAFLLGSALYTALTSPPTQTIAISSPPPALGTVICTGAAGAARPQMRIDKVVSLSRTGKASFKIVRADGDYVFIDMDSGMCIFSTDPLAYSMSVNADPPKKGDSI